MISIIKNKRTNSIKRILETRVYNWEIKAHQLYLRKIKRIPHFAKKGMKTISNYIIQL